VTFDEARAEFPVLERLAYLNAGSIGPLAKGTAAAMAARLAAELEAGRGGIAQFLDLLEVRGRVRAAVAALTHVPVENVALTSSTTDGCNIVLGGLALGPDDEVVTTDVEHFGLLGPVGASPARVRVAAVRERLAAEALDAILAAVTPRTRLIALSHVAWTTGHVLPVAELAERGGPALLVDGAQSIGAVPVDVTPFDFYTVSGQKWLCGPDATGALVVREPERWAVALPSYLSQDGYEADGTFTPRAGAARYEPGWTPSASLVGLRTAMELVPEGRFERARAMAERCRELLAERVEIVTEPGHATLVTWRADRPAEAVVRALEAGVIIREMPKLGWLRASVGWWTNENDLQRLVAAVT
jgi:L-cysteine/cystine lyase